MTMAASQPPSHLGALDMLVNDVLVQTGKAFKSSRREARRVPSGASVNRIHDTHVSFNSVLDEVESELTRAKAVLQRDLDQLRAKRRPVVIPEPVMIPLTLATPAAPEAAAEPHPATPVLVSPGPLTRTVPKQPGLNPLPRPHPRSKQGAPFPNMGINTPPFGTSPQSTAVKVKTEPHAIPKPTTPFKSTVQVARPVVHTSSAAVQAALLSPALKSIPPLVGKAGGLPAKKPIVPNSGKPGSPVSKVAALPTARKSSPSTAPATPAPKATPPAGPKVAPAPTPGLKASALVPVSAEPDTSISVSITSHVPVPSQSHLPPDGRLPALAPPSSKKASQLAPPAGHPDPLSELSNTNEDASVGGGVAGGIEPGSLNPQLGFTDMQFSVAPASLEPHTPAHGRSQGGNAVDAEFDLDTFVADATNNLLSDSFSGGAGDQPSSVLASGPQPIDFAGGGGGGIVHFKDSTTEAMDNSIDALFRMDDDADLGAGSEVAGDTNFDNLWIEADSNIEDLDGKYFGLV